MTKSKAIIIIPIIAAAALAGTGFGAWVFSSSASTSYAGVNMELTDAYGYSDLKVEWINKALKLDQSNTDISQGATISPISFSIKYTAEIELGGDTTYTAGANGELGSFTYTDHSLTGTRTVEYGYSVTIKTNKMSEYIVPTLTIQPKNTDYYKAKTDVESISNVGDTISVVDRITASASETVTVEDIVTISFEWKHVPNEMDGSGGAAFNYAALKALAKEETPMSFNINMAAEKELSLSNVNLDKTVDFNNESKTLRSIAASSNQVIFGKLSDSKYSAIVNDNTIPCYEAGKSSDDIVYQYVVTDSGKTTTYILSDSQIVLTDADNTVLDEEKLQEYGTMENLLASGVIGLFGTLGSSITDLTLENIDTFNMTTGAYMFCFMTNLKKLTISGMDTSQMTSMEYMFGFCTSLETLDISCFDTRNVTNMNTMFCKCPSLKTITVSDKFTMENVTESTQMFSYDVSLVGPDDYKYSEHFDVASSKIDVDGTYAEKFLTVVSDSDA